MTELERVLALDCNTIRERLSQANISHLDLTIEIEGRVDSLNPLKLTYKLGSYSDRVEGDNLEAVVSEYLRRVGWQGQHQYLALTKPTTEQLIDDEIPCL